MVSNRFRANWLCPTEVFLSSLHDMLGSVTCFGRLHFWFLPNIIKRSSICDTPSLLGSGKIEQLNSTTYTETVFALEGIYGDDCGWGGFCLRSVEQSSAGSLQSWAINLRKSQNCSNWWPFKPAGAFDGFRSLEGGKLIASEFTRNHNSPTNWISSVGHSTVITQKCVPSLNPSKERLLAMRDGGTIPEWLRFRNPWWCD